MDAAKTFEEIGDILGISAHQAKHICNAALVKLKRNNRRELARMLDMASELDFYHKVDEDHHG